MHESSSITRISFLFCLFYLKFAELRDKYAITQNELSEKNTSLQEAEYDLQKRNHRVEKLIKRLTEVEKQCKSLPVGVTSERVFKGEQAANAGEVTRSCMI